MIKLKVDRNDNAQDQDIQEVEHEIEEIEENDIQEISQVDSAANDIQEINPQQSTSQNQVFKLILTRIRIRKNYV